MVGVVIERKKVAIFLAGCNTLIIGAACASWGIILSIKSSWRQCMAWRLQRIAAA